MNSNFNKINKNTIIKSCLAHFAYSLQKSFTTTLDISIEELLLQADCAKSNNDEALLIKQYNYLKARKNDLSSALGKVINAMPKQFTQKMKQEVIASELTLVDDKELAINLIYKQMEATLDVKFINHYFAIEKRLKVLLQKKDVSKSNMLFGSVSTSWIFNKLLEMTSLETSTKTMIVSLLTKELTENLETALKNINDIFVKANILPNIKLEAKKSDAKPSSKIKKETKKEELTESEKQHSHYSQQSNELVSSIFDLLNKNKKSKPETSKLSYHINHKLMDDSLADLSQSPDLTLGNVEMNNMKEMLLQNISKSSGIKSPRLSHEQENTMDIMGMFYEKVKLDSDIDNNLLTSFNSINIPLIRTAVMDQEFFDNEEHPAREYLEKIIFASQIWHGTSVIKDINKFSANIANAYDGTPESFVEANEMLESHLRLTKKRSVKAEEKWINTMKGKEKLAVSRNKAQSTIDDLEDTTTHKFISDVLNHVVKDSLTLSLLRNGDDSLQWRKHMETTSTLAKMGDSEKIKEVTAKQKVESLHHLDETMEQLGFSGNDRSKTINNIQNLADAANQNKTQEKIEISEVVSINEKRNYQKLQPGSVKLEELRELNSKEKSELTKLRLTKYGTIFDFFKNQQRDKIRRRLSWFSTVSNNALFVSLLGNKPHEQSLNSLAMDLARNNIIEVKLEPKKYFNNVLGDIFNKLKSKIA